MRALCYLHSGEKKELPIRFAALVPICSSNDRLWRVPARSLHARTVDVPRASPHRGRPARNGAVAAAQLEAYEQGRRKGIRARAGAVRVQRAAQPGQRGVCDGVEHPRAGVVGTGRQHHHARMVHRLCGQLVGERAALGHVPRLQPPGAGPHGAPALARRGAILHVSP